MISKKALLFVVLLAFVFPCALAYNQAEIAVWSKSMRKEVPVMVITPDGYDGTTALPVVYLLHGHGGDHRAWTKDGVVGRLSDQYDVIVVMPDGGRDSWYFDSPKVPGYRYETFVGKELVAYIDAHYATIAKRTCRAITGLSMGGHGAFYVAMRHQDTFGNMGSLSGGLDIRPFPKNWNIAGRLGTIEAHPERWEKHTVINMIHLLSAGKMNIVFECGTEDFFYKVNCNMHKALLEAKIPHEYYVRPGAHNWPYWLNGIKYQFLYFSDKFNASQKSDKK